MPTCLWPPVNPPLLERKRRGYQCFLVASTYTAWNSVSFARQGAAGWGAYSTAIKVVTIPTAATPFVPQGVSTLNNSHTDAIQSGGTNHGIVVASGDGSARLGKVEPKQIVGRKRLNLARDGPQG